MKIPFSPPYVDEAVELEVLDALRSGWITSGPKVQQLEQEIAKMCGGRRVVCVNSWTSGAILMLSWFGVGAGDEVIVPAYTYSATALAVLHVGARPVMVDVGEDFNVTADAIRAAITPRTKVVLPVDFGGFPCDYASIVEVVSSEEERAKFCATTDAQRMLGRILVLSDAAHSMGGWIDRVRGVRTGAGGDVTIFSLHAVKNVTTAEGGAICLNLPLPFDCSVLYKQLKLYSLNCQTKDAFTKSQAGGWRYDITGLGYKVNLADVNAAIGLAQIRQYDSKLLPMRKRVFERYVETLSRYDWAILPSFAAKDGRESSYHLLALRLAGLNDEKRDAVIMRMAERGVAVNVHFIPMPMLTLFKGLGYKIDDYPVALANFSHEISLPVYPQLTQEAVDYVLTSLVEAVER